MTSRGNLRFDPDGHFECLDTAETDLTDGDFTYSAYDGDADSAAAAVEVTVTGVNDAPVCSDLSITTDEDTPSRPRRLHRRRHRAPHYAIVTQPIKGMASVVSSNLRFDPNGQYEALDTGESDPTNGDFTYKANDGTVDSNTADVDVTVTGVNDAPVCLSARSRSTRTPRPVTVELHGRRRRAAHLLRHPADEGHLERTSSRTSASTPTATSSVSIRASRTSPTATSPTGPTTATPTRPQPRWR